MYPPGWTLERELRERRQSAPGGPRAAPPPPERLAGPTGPPPRPQRPPSPHRVDTSERGPSNRQLLRRALSSPGAARQAFLLREVLGPPVALRDDNSSDRPS